MRRLVFAIIFFTKTVTNKRTAHFIVSIVISYVSFVHFVSIAIAFRVRRKRFAKRRVRMSLGLGRRVFTVFFAERVAFRIVISLGAFLAIVIFAMIATTMVVRRFYVRRFVVVVSVFIIFRFVQLFFFSRVGKLFIKILQSF